MSSTAGSDRAGAGRASLQDVQQAIAALGALDESRLDLGRVAIVGHSAGGHLALLAAAGRPYAGVEIAGVLALAAVSDLALADELDLGDGAVGELLGDHPAARADASPRARLPLGVRHVHVHGDADDRVPVAITTAFVEAAGREASVTVLPGVDHFDPDRPLERRLGRCSPPTGAAPAPGGRGARSTAVATGLPPRALLSSAGAGRSGRPRPRAGPTTSTRRSTSFGLNSRSRLHGARSSESVAAIFPDGRVSGARGARTPDLQSATLALSQLSYGPLNSLQSRDSSSYAEAQCTPTSWLFRDGASRRRTSTRPVAIEAGSM